MGVGNEANLRLDGIRDRTGSAEAAMAGRAAPAAGVAHLGAVRGVPTNITTETMKRSNRKQPVQGMCQRLATALLLGGGLVSTYGQAATEPPKTNHWESTAAAAVTLTRGNSETFLATISLDTKRKWEKDELAFGVAGGYGESTVNEVNSKNTEFVNGFGQYNHLFTSRFYGGLRLDGAYDGIAGIDYRFKVSPLAGYYLIKNDKMTLAVEAGPAVVFEHLKGEEARSYWAARFGERFEYKLTATTKFWESVDYIPQVDHWSENYLVNFEAGIDTAITKHWSLRVVFQDMYASDPAPGRKQNDIRLLAGTAYKF
jgi:putative salt-induced outer membrane protein YdiY